MGVLPNLAIIAILISNCTSAPNGAISFESIRYYVDDKFHDEIPEAWNVLIRGHYGDPNTLQNAYI